MGFVMVLNLVSLRFVVDALGLEDYGIYDAVAGVVSLLSIIGTVLSSSIQRYYSYALGEHDYEKVNNVFITSISLFAILSILILLILETGGLYFLNTQLVIPELKLNAANWVFQFSVISFIMVMIEVPFTALIVSHEDIKVFAIISTVECIGKFIVALSIKYSPIEYLVYYSGGLLFFKGVSFFLYLLYCKRNYKECVYHRIREYSTLKAILSFSMWSSFSTLSSIVIFQGSALLINMFFGPLIGGARAISIQVSSAVTSFASTFFMALNPPIVKSCANGEYGTVSRLFNIGNVFCYYALLMVVVPLFLETDTILKIWLNTTDNFAILFTKSMLVFTVVLAINQPVTALIRALGYVKEYHLPVESILILSFPATFIFYKLGFPAIYNCYILIFFAIVAHVVRILVLRKYFPFFQIKQYLSNFLLSAVFNTTVIFLFLFVLHTIIENAIIRLLIIAFTNVILIGVFVYFISLTKEDKLVIKRNIEIMKK